MKSGHLWIGGLMALGMTFGLGSRSRTVSAAAEQPRESAPSAPGKTYVLTVFWVKETATRRASSPPKDGLPFDVPAEPEKMDLTASLQPLNRGWKFRQVAALSVPFPGEGEQPREAKVTTPDGDFSLRPISLEFKKDGRANIKYAFSGSLDGEGMGSPGLISISWQVGKSYSIGSTGDADFTERVQAFMCVTEAKTDSAPSP